MCHLSLLRQNDVATSVWRNNYVIITSCAPWEAFLWIGTGAYSEEHQRLCIVRPSLVACRGGMRATSLAHWFMATLYMHTGCTEINWSKVDSRFELVCLQLELRGDERGVPQVFLWIKTHRLFTLKCTTGNWNVSNTSRILLRFISYRVKWNIASVVKVVVDWLK